MTIFSIHFGEGNTIFMKSMLFMSACKGLVIILNEQKKITKNSLVLTSNVVNINRNYISFKSGKESWYYDV